MTDSTTEARGGKRRQNGEDRAAGEVRTEGKAMDIPSTLAALTPEEKAALLSGGGSWETTEVERLGISSMVLTDGPHGLRLQDPSAEHFGFEASLPATCFPTAAALASSWDTELLTEVGQVLGAESRAAGVAVLLGPGINIKRSPLCGRDFEYLSEDPHLSGRLGAALVRGMQSRGVGASVKHFAATNQETERMRVSAQVDERTLREICLAAFEHVVTAAEPWTVMAAYKRINGVHAAQDPWLLTEVLREEWGFAGLVVSDRGAVSDPVAALAAGLDLEMPSTNGAGAARLVEAVRARRAATESAVLLQNEGALLPLDPDAPATVAVIGEFTRTPRFQGAGSSRVEPGRVDNAWEALNAGAGEHLPLSFSPGFTLTGEENETLLSEAVEAATAADVSVMFLGLPEGEESEGFDRTHLDLPDVQHDLLEAVAQVNDNVVVVLGDGPVVRTSPWEHNCRAALEGWLTGQAGGGAIADLLPGRTNPCGRLAETIPLPLEDNPSYLDFSGAEGVVPYGERLYVGYRSYDARDMEVGHPFGHGLSYTTFAYSDLHTEVERQGENVAVRLRLSPLHGRWVLESGDESLPLNRLVAMSGDRLDTTRLGPLLDPTP
ncbi:glycoside hydrolase family 3 C-terminal domain-containing protein [Streptomyces sp. NPDC006385]|uniref:glycoside hydrolase family 3 C-terminal domain-containing protein n=1 Tax=Streptomyces sp. NPDC006385 TaxID=3156761 RepID=UPI0033A6FF17